MSAEIIVAIITVVPATLAAIGGWRHARGANRATNQTPEGEPRLVDRIRGMEERQIRQETALGGVKEDVAEIRSDVRSIVERLMHHD